MGSTLSLATGDAFDVKIKPTVVKRTNISTFEWQTDMRYELTNALPRPVMVKLMQAGLWGESRIKAESQKSTRPDAASAMWAVSIPANGTSTVTASFATRY
jgi:hypothetical protein